MLKKVELLLFLAIVAGLVIFSNRLVENVSSQEIERDEIKIVIDAGHGGNDPGKVGVNDALEKDINLQIAKKVKELLEEKDMKVVMTRVDDVMLGSGESNNKKLQDMKERVSLMKQEKPDLVVSIHQNSYTDSSVSGAQVFYYTGSKEGERAAKLMQEALLSINENNKRQAKANDSYYLLKHVDAPAIIVECGFLSNPQEAEKLITEEYQYLISNAIVKGIESCFVN